ncbi:MAG: hypothetical protein JXB14_08055 [Candidatus Altiarchaeota archaeon]|nr:hypothetical protein [Candidatus Altiarchaeota archaeon]
MKKKGKVVRFTLIGKNYGPIFYGDNVDIRCLLWNYLDELEEAVEESKNTVRIKTQAKERIGTLKDQLGKEELNWALIKGALSWLKKNIRLPRGITGILSLFSNL